MTTAPALIENGRLNPGYLKLDLFCKGLRIAEDCSLDGAGPRRMRSGLGSGLELRIPRSGGMCVNAPVVESFARESPYTLHGPSTAGRHLLRRDGRDVCELIVQPPPRFYETRTTGGVRMGSVGVIQGTYLGIYYGTLCANWKHPELDNCRFCSIGDNVGAGDDTTGKSPRDILETAAAARAELGITFVHLNGGFDDTGAYLERFVPVLSELRKTGLLTGVQLPPLPDFEQYRALRALGVNNVSLCFEIWNEQRFQEVCPGKARRCSHARYRDAIRFCAQDVRFDTTNGELIAGLERPEDSMAAVDWLTGVGAVPTVCVFRPVPGTPYQHLPPPDTESMVPIFAHLYERCMDAGLPIGVAPNVHVSIVMNPEECRWLLPSERRRGWRLRRAKLAVMRSLFAWRVSAGLRRLDS